ncbi:MAG: hypothetical protein ACNA8W_12390 [Bradymonadaceae bacterium]
MTFILPVFAIVVSVGALASAFMGRGLARVFVALGWLGAFTGVGLVYFEQAGSLGDALAIAALTAVGVLPAMMEAGRRRRLVLSTGSLLPVALGLASLGVVLFAPTTTPGTSWLLLIVQAGVIGVAVSSAISAAALTDGPWEKKSRPVHLGLPLVIVGLSTGLAIIGALRATLAGSLYALPLATEEGPLIWGWAEGSLQGQRLPVVMTVDWMVTGLIAVALVAIAAAVVASRRPLLKAGAALYGLSGAIALGLLSNVVYLTGQLLNPSPQPYADLARQMLSGEGLPERLVEDGAFLLAGPARVDILGMGPEFLILGLIFLFATMQAVHLLRDRESTAVEEAESTRIWRRGLMARAIVFGWLAWLVALVFHLEWYGVIGLVGPGEWMILGGMLLSTGLVVMTWEDGKETPFTRVLRRAIPGVLASVWIIGICTAYGYGAFFAVSALMR